MKQRLYYLDALRTMAILMMLQGHWISGLLDTTSVDINSLGYQIWKYCRGFTAPVFFTLSGWVFSYLLFAHPQKGIQNPRVSKGLKRALELLFWGYLLRLNIWSLFDGYPNRSFFLPDVLQIIGLSLLLLLALYFISRFYASIYGLICLAGGLIIFFYEPLYSTLVFPELPSFIAAYLTKAEGGVFYLFPWLGYVLIGGFLGSFSNEASLLSTKSWILLSLLVGLSLIFFSSKLLILIHQGWGWELPRAIAYNNYLFIRLGDVLVCIAFFKMLEPRLRQHYWSLIGRHTFSIYIVHYFLLYGSLSGYGAYKFWSKSMSLSLVLFSALLFILVCLGLVFAYTHYKETFLKRFQK